MENEANRSCHTQKKQNFSEFVKNFLKSHENDVNTIIQINQLSNESGIEKRRLYDFMNVLVACGICSKFNTHSYQWNGLHCLNNLVSNISHEIEVRAIREDPTFLFNLPKSPTIGNLVNSFLGVFVYFGIPSFHIKDIALLFSDDEEKSKPMLRRLYLVSFLLERIGIMKHSTKVGECQIDVDLNQTMKTTFETMSKNSEFPPDCIEHQLNRFDDLYITRLRIDRREQLVNHLQMRVDKIRKNNKSYNLELLSRSYEVGL
ncbi:hypothetical protein GPJ56_004297 [Histomonas meleagridis]|uniref:uncharacterized protein n=1 Tax=Histomonas meleagridis TaxID=135588 RepID=UPI00355A50FE|nr:hypothetical protein GPJ56_004297 [Histomonas meleagridis]KAH0800488.1 hypothetical protein GO595_006691 [Histomonas meleagridis]